MADAIELTKRLTFIESFDFTQHCLDTYRSADVNPTISPDETMWSEHYFEIGWSAVDVILRGLCAARISQVQRVLDLPCGHGRVLRHLRAMFRDAHIDACDLDESGVEFCRDTLGVNGIVSVPDLTKAPIPGNYDLIWVGSLFTHISRDLAKRWMDHLATLLSPTGIVVATVHGRWCEHAHKRAQYISADKWAKVVNAYRASGYGYASYSEAENHDFIQSEADYGVSLVRPSVTIGDIEAIPGVRLYAYMERAWADHQDAVVFRRPAFDMPWP
jgi:SAM-dependent methyltransferase